MTPRGRQNRRRRILRQDARRDIRDKTKINAEQPVARGVCTIAYRREDGIVAVQQGLLKQRLRVREAHPLGTLGGGFGYDLSARLGGHIAWSVNVSSGNISHAMRRATLNSATSSANGGM